MTWLVALFVRWGLRGRYATAAAYTALIVGAVLVAMTAWQLWIHFHDRRVIRDHEAAVNADIATTARGNDARARGTTDELINRSDELQAELKETRDAAAKVDPAGAARPVGPATAATVERLRRAARDREASR